MKLEHIEKRTYPDGTFYPVIVEFKEHIVYRINSYNDIWFLKQIKDVYDSNRKPLSITIPNLLDAQADGRFMANSSFNLKLICKEINNLKFEKVNIFHPHNPSIPEALIENLTILSNEVFISEVLFEIAEDIGGNLEKNLVLMSTDAGGFKPLMKLCDNISWKGETTSATKSRSMVDGKSVLVQGLEEFDFVDKNILIIDDICVYGGTFAGIAEILEERGFTNKLYLAVSHMTVENPNQRIFENFDMIYTTNSKGLEYVDSWEEEPDNLKICRWM